MKIFLPPGLRLHRVIVCITIFSATIALPLASASFDTAISDAEIQEAHQGLIRHAIANNQNVEVVPGSFKIISIDHIGVTGTVLFQKIGEYGSWRGDFRIDRMPDGGLCFHYGRGKCIRFPAAEEVSIEKYNTTRTTRVERVLREKEQAEMADKKNAKHHACFVEMSENRVTSRESSACEEWDYTKQGAYCMRRGTSEVVTEGTYEVNRCKYTLRFQEVCGSTAFTNNVVAPGGRFDPKFKWPCFRIYK